jgi:hypothetical protein
MEPLYSELRYEASTVSATGAKAAMLFALRYSLFARGSGVPRTPPLQKCGQHLPDASHFIQKIGVFKRIQEI